MSIFLFAVRRWTLGVALAAVACVASARGEQPGQLFGRSALQWQQQLASRSGAARHEAAWAIAQLAGRLDTTASVSDRASRLAPLLADQDAGVRYWGVLGLGWLAEGRTAAEQESLAAAAAPLLADASFAPRLAAAEVLARLGRREQALPVLLAGLQNPQEAVRIQAAASLERLGNDPAVQAALQTSRQDDSEYVKRISESATRAGDSR